MKDWHVHIGQYFDEYYDFHDVFQILKNNGVSEVDEPVQFEKWFFDFQDVEVHLAHCKDSKPIIQLFSKYKNCLAIQLFAQKIPTMKSAKQDSKKGCFSARTFR